MVHLGIYRSKIGREIVKIAERRTNEQKLSKLGSYRLCLEREIYSFSKNIKTMSIKICQSCKAL